MFAAEVRACALVLSSALVLSFGIALSSGCASQRATHDADGKPFGAMVYFPAATGNSWAYLVDKRREDGGTDTILANTRVIASAVDQFALQSGDEIATYEIKPEGVFKSQLKYFVLKNPIVAGSRWPIFNAEGEVRIERVGFSEVVAAGRFDGCILVVEEIFQDQRVEWTYAPHVGPIRMRVYLLDGGPETLLIDSQLKAYHLEPLAPAEHPYQVVRRRP